MEVQVLVVIGHSRQSYEYMKFLMHERGGGHCGEQLGRKDEKVPTASIVIKLTHDKLMDWIVML